MNRPHSILICCIALVLAILSFNVKPIGYLHSWNQITTLVHISALSRDLTSWHKPHDVVTRLPVSDTKITVAAPFDDFRIFEEPPLYHLISALLSRVGSLGARLSQIFSPENAARFVSIAMWAFGAFGIFHLGASTAAPLVATITLFLYCCSFPVAYYGAAIMSDSAMTSMWIWSLVYCGRWARAGRYSNLLAAVACGCLAGLFKSYGLIALIPPLALETYRVAVMRAPLKRLFPVIALAAVAAMPTLLWHWYAAMSPGHQEFQSHSLPLKLNTIASFEFWNALQKGYFRYLSYVMGGVAILSGIFWIKAKSPHIPQTIWLAALTAVLFIFATADKIPHHDYYLLMPAVPVFVIVATSTSRTLLLLPTRLQLPVLCVLIIGMAAPALFNVRKALREHSDVIPCAELVAAHTTPPELIATYADVTRYNSIAHYAGRFGVRVEDTSIPIRRYHAAGANSLVVDLPPTQFEQFEGWLNKQRATTSISQIRAVDYKGQPRVCGIYRFAP
jgi:hypothetical protein